MAKATGRYQKLGQGRYYLETTEGGWYASTLGPDHSRLKGRTITPNFASARFNRSEPHPDFPVLVEGEEETNQEAEEATQRSDTGQSGGIGRAIVRGIRAISSRTRMGRETTRRSWYKVCWPCGKRMTVRSSRRNWNG